MRLSKSEVDYFDTSGYLEEKTEFGNSELVYTLKSNANGKELSAKFEGNTISISIPESIKKSWVKTNQIGIENKLDIGMGKKLFLLIEKDFVCLDNTIEDQSDNYLNPNATC